MQFCIFSQSGKLSKNGAGWANVFIAARSGLRPVPRCGRSPGAANPRSAPGTAHRPCHRSLAVPDGLSPGQRFVTALGAPWGARGTPHQPWGSPVVGGYLYQPWGLRGGLGVPVTALGAPMGSGYPALALGVSSWQAQGTCTSPGGSMEGSGYLYQCWGLPLAGSGYLYQPWEPPRGRGTPH